MLRNVTLERGLGEIFEFQTPNTIADSLTQRNNEILGYVPCCSHT